jgi:hypothetical protein
MMKLLPRKSRISLTGTDQVENGDGTSRLSYFLKMKSKLEED